MTTLTFQADFASWRRAARTALAKGLNPEEIFWDDGSQTLGLFAAASSDSASLGDGGSGGGSGKGVSPLKIPAAFFSLAEQVACHRDIDRWSLLYRLAWRIVHGGERQLLLIETDPEVCRLNALARAVRRDRHKMTAFVRFRKVDECESSGREQFVAWFEPDHNIVELTASFFAKRFAGMDWSILTPDKCAHWDGEHLHFTAGVEKSAAPDRDELDDYWRSYYASIFNPSRLKLKAMQSEMPMKYWRNLPEAPLIQELSTASTYRTGRMIEAGANEKRAHVSAKIPAGVPAADPQPVALSPAEFVSGSADASLDQLRAAAGSCRACPLHENATRTVFGEGPEDARIMIVGEQPGDREDLIGRPFVGPAGQLLDRALAEAGIERQQCYLTNTVKHFKWKPGAVTASNSRGGQRLHKNPNASEVQVCKPWLIAEALRIRPAVFICLGATAARAFIRPDFRVSTERGLVKKDFPLAERLIATVHPSSLLRTSDHGAREAAFSAFVDDLRLGR